MLFPSKIINVNGGLGNQMFQYAFGQKLKQMSGCDVVYDINIYNDVNDIKDNGFLPNGTSQRSYQLGIFNLNINFVSKEEADKAKYIKKTKLRGFFRKIFHIQKYKTNIKTEKNAFEYDESLFRSNKLYYEGYFQNPKYLEGIEDKLRKDFTFPQITDEYNLNILNKIQAGENSVFIHIRRGDYLNLGWELNTDYYKKAIDYIIKNVENPHFFIFGLDCEDFIKNNFKLNYPVEIIGGYNSKNNEAWKDMYLMSQCRHAIIANSTFSWWGAWLGGNFNKRIILAPDPFVENSSSIIPGDWKKIPTPLRKDFKIAVLYICTGRYTVFWKDFYTTCEQYFLKNHKKTYFVFTDSPHIDFEDKKEVKRIYQKKLGWPFDTLMRFDMFLTQKEELQKYNYIFFCNANLLFKQEIKEDILPDKYAHGGIVVTQHPGFYDKNNKDFPYDRNPKSTAYIPMGSGVCYAAGGFNGGEYKEYVQLCEELSKNIHKDLDKNVIALWHDESQLNKYIINRKYKILPCNYLYPEGWDISEYKYDIKILIRDKAKEEYGGHEYLRGVEAK